MTKGIAIFKVWYMVLEDMVCFFDGNEEIKPRIRLAGAGVGAGTFSYHIGNKTTYKFLVEDIIAANCLDFVHAMATMLTRYFVFNMSCDKPVDTTLIFFQKYKY